MKRANLTYQLSAEAGAERPAIDPYFVDASQICSPLGFLVEHLLQRYKPNEACLAMIAQQVSSSSDF